MAEADIYYSNHPLAAFLAAIVASYERQFGGQGYLGRTAMQKLAYVCQALGVPVPTRFELYTYGPYSDEVSATMESLLADEVALDKAPESRYSNYRTGANSQVLLSRFRGELAPHMGRIDAVVQALGPLKPEELELMATLHFVYERERQFFPHALPIRSKVLSEFKQVKKDKFTDIDISRVYDLLVTAGLFSTTVAG